MVDERSRLFERLNVIDVSVAAAVLVLLALGYGAFVLFRTPTPTITAIEPAQISLGEPGTVRIAGTNLRPFLSVRFGTFTGTLLVTSPAAGEIRVEKLPPGTYDLVLLDEVRELLRVPAALTVVPAPVVPVGTPALAEMEMQAVGAFTYLSEQDAALVREGTMLDQETTWTPTAEVLALRPPEIGTQRVRVSDSSVVTTPVPGKLQVPAIIRLRCVVTAGRCKVGEGADVVRDAMIPLAISVPLVEKYTRPATHLVFRIDELRPVDSPVAFPSAARVFRMQMQATGHFIYLSDGQAPLIQVGSRFEQPTTPSSSSASHAAVDEPVAQVLAIRAPEPGTQRVRVSPTSVVSTPVPGTLQVPAIVRLGCEMTGDLCRVGDVNVTQGAMIPLASRVVPAGPPTGSEISMVFRIDELRPVDAPVAFPSAAPVVTATATLRVHFLVRPEVVNVIKVGDVDLGDAADLADIGRAALVSLDPGGQQITVTTRMNALEFQDTMTAVDATVRVSAVLTPAGWQYKGKPLKAGAPFSFERVSYAIDGWILSAQFGPSSQDEAR